MGMRERAAGAPTIPVFLAAAVDAMDPATRVEFIRKTCKETPKSKVQIELAKHGLTVKDVRRWLNVTYCNRTGEPQR